MMKRLVLLAVLAFCLNVQHAHGGTFYLSMSSLLRAGEPTPIYILDLQPDDGDSSVEVTVELWKKPTDSYSAKEIEEEVLATVSDTVATTDSDIDEELILNVPSPLPETDWRSKLVIVVSVTMDGETIEKEETVTVQDQPALAIVIQTDKPLYKPGDIIQYRVLAHDEELKILMDPFDVEVRDANGNLVSQERQVTPPSGLLTSDFDLGDHPVLGDWKIKAIFNSIEKEKILSVEEYVLPKFEVEVSGPPFSVVPYDDNMEMTFDPVPITVTAKYTYGKPVEGTVCLELSRYTSYYYFDAEDGDDDDDSGSNESDELPCSKPETLEDGTFTKVYTIDQLVSLMELGSPSQLNWNTVQMTASVQETLTDVVLTGSSTLVIKSESLKLEFPESSPKNYQPGFSYTGQVKVTRADGSPLESDDFMMPDGDERLMTLEFNMQCGWRSDGPECTQMSLDSQQFSVPSDGLVEFSVSKDYLGSEYQSMSVTAKITDKYGIESMTSASIASFQTTTNVGIKLEQEGGFRPLQAGDTQTFIVTTTEKINKFYYEVYSKGAGVMHGKESRSKSKSHTFSIEISGETARQMAPTSKLIVWYITESGTTPELIAATILLSVAATDVFENKMTLSTAGPDVVEPSASVTVEGTAEPGSVVALLAIDKSLTLLGSGNDITTDDVLEYLASFDPSGGLDGPGFYPCICWLRVFRRRKRSFWGGCYPSSPLIGDVGDVYQYANVLAFTSADIFKTNDYDHFHRADSGRVFLSASPGVRYKGAAVDDVDADPVKNKEALKPVTKTRSNFVETWIFLDTTANEDGYFSHRSNVPDTITSWIISGFTIHPLKGFGIAEPDELTVFQPFFISTTLPYSVVRYEEFRLRITVFNYLEEKLNVLLTVDKSQYFKIGTGNSTARMAKFETELKLEANSGETVDVWVKPYMLGEMPVFISAQSSEAADRVEKKILVKAEGVQRTVSKNKMVILDSSTSNEELSAQIHLPDNYVDDSLRITVTVVGDVMGSALQNIDDLLRMPYGCGEQNMINFAPNIFILKYLEATNQATDAIREKAENYMQAGYNGEMRYMRDDHSFSAFGNRDSSGSTWLTAFVAKSFTQAIPYLNKPDTANVVDLVNLKESIEWVLSKQNSDGGFQSVGFVHHQELKGGTSNDEGNVALTAYILVMLEEYEQSVATDLDVSSEKSRAASYLVSWLNEDQTDNYYPRALTAYALCLMGHSKKGKAFQKLNEIAIYSGDMKYWTTDGEPDNADDDDENARGYWYYEPPSHNIEMTAYAMLATMTCGSLDDAIPIMKWIVPQSNELGGYGNTQATVMALQALAAFGTELHGTTSTQNLVAMVHYGNTNDEFEAVTDSNTLLVQKKEVEYLPGTNDISVSASGSGVAVVQVIWHYNVHQPGQSDAFDFTCTSRTTNDYYDNVFIECCTEWLKSTDSNMVLMEISSLSGFEFVSNEVSVVEQDRSFKRVENNGDKLVVYMDEISDGRKCVQLNQGLVVPVANMKPSVATVYSYYQTELMTVDLYIPDELENGSRCTVDPVGCGIIINPSTASSRAGSMSTIILAAIFIWKMVALLTRN